MPAEVRGVAFTKHGRRPSRIWSVRHAHSECSHELCIERHKSRPRRNTDLWAVETGRISVTPIKLDLTAGISQGPGEGRLNTRQRRRTKQGRHSNAAFSEY
jgi:broad specificity polyphosphatase/5'/3'-nucleotidase SurE